MSNGINVPGHNISTYVPLSHGLKLLLYTDTPYTETSIAAVTFWTISLSPAASNVTVEVDLSKDRSRVVTWIVEFVWQELRPVVERVSAARSCVGREAAVRRRRRRNGVVVRDLMIAV